MVVAVVTRSSSFVAFNCSSSYSVHCPHRRIPIDEGDMENSELSKLLASASTKDSIINATDDKVLLQLIVKSINLLTEQVKDLQRSNKNIEQRLELQDLKEGLEKDFHDKNELEMPTDSVIGEQETNIMLGVSDRDDASLNPTNDVFRTPDKGKQLKGQKSWKELVYSFEGEKVKEVNMATMKGRKARISESNLVAAAHSVGKQLFMSPSPSTRRRKSKNTGGNIEATEAIDDTSEVDLGQCMDPKKPLVASRRTACLITAGIPN